VTLIARDGGDPELSVVMVTHGAQALTRRAVDALVANTENSFELIIVDNHSDEEMRAWLSELRDVKVIFNDSNRGFGPATNQGAAVARGEYLLLLNSDAFVHPGWLEPLRAALDEEGVGASFPRLLHPDGSLQDAGVLLAKDGTVLVYGDGDDPQRLCYRFRRFVDTGTAACMLMRRTVFDAFGGFDERYAPAYYEDVDLSMRLAQRGLRVLYEPRALVTHQRYGSSNTAQAAELSERNRGRFVERWADELLGRPATFRRVTPQAAIAARDAMATPRVLIASSLSDPSAGAVASGIMADWPSGRVTWALDGCAHGAWDVDPWLRIGVEIVCEHESTWLEDRLFHYDLVIFDPGSGGLSPIALDRTQPQAPRIRLSDIAGSLRDGRTVAQLAAAGIAREP
jgi:GT2 family glycosyltransferase